ncbi:ubiquitin-like-conjugating enzyme ATG10 [Schistocerca cancellata]|uniref:ubiquitin-like-conjugating enzyme ATG10 n=1 Tax=Schistocerca cancellata TaxID=274614 RepID=UPI002118000A|nr:ubiquitin-like-conjugating enzyme ATG10 [Schistocerca cancellata]
MAGTITWEYFLKCSDELLRISDIINDDWVGRGNKNVAGSYYLAKTTKRSCMIVKENNEAADYLEDLELERHETDNESVSSNARDRASEWEYHVLYNISYSVPVLYFNACFSDGSLFSLEQLWQLLSYNFKGTLEPQKWSVLTQQEHPVLGRPFFQLHPCRTAKFLEIFEGCSSNLLITWLSSVGPLVGLELPLQYSHEHHHKNYTHTETSKEILQDSVVNHSQIHLF